MRRIWWMLALGALLLAACAGASAPEDASGGAAPMEAPMPAEAPAMDRASGEALPLESGAVLIEINRDPTPLSGAAHAVLRGPAALVLPHLLKTTWPGN